MGDWRPIGAHSRMKNNSILRDIDIIKYIPAGSCVRRYHASCSSLASAIGTATSMQHASLDEERADDCIRAW